MSPKDVRFEQLFRKYYQDVVHLLVRSGAERETARDLAQETFTRVYRGLEGYRGDGIRTWIWTIAKNQWSNHLRNQAALRRAAEVSEQAEIKESQKTEPTPWTPTIAAPDRQTLNHEQIERLNRAIDELPPRLRQVFLLRFKQDLKYREIAALMGIRLDTVKAQLHDARGRIKRALDGVEFEDEEHG